MAVADLIEICFASTMDADGQQYLRNMRQAAHDATFLHWATGMAERTAMPLSGYVWEENGQIVGNLSLIPLVKQGRRVYLVANVAVHPDYRRRGIARTLTETAIDHARQRLASSVWLQVRHDNSAALQLYGNLGFIEQARRATWQSTPDQLRKPGSRGSMAVITRRYSTDWEQHRAWLAAIYPPAVTWNLPLNINNFRPSFFADLFRFLSNTTIQHWAVRQDGRMLGLLTWEASRTATDSLWLATTQEFEDQAIESLLPNALLGLSPFRPVSLNYPAGQAEEVLRAAGFQAHQVLIWMEIQFKT